MTFPLGPDEKQLHILNSSYTFFFLFIPMLITFCKTQYIRKILFPFVKSYVYYYLVRCLCSNIQQLYHVLKTRKSFQSVEISPPSLPTSFLSVLPHLISPFFPFFPCLSFSSSLLDLLKMFPPNSHLQSTDFLEQQIFVMSVQQFGGNNFKPM